MKMIQEKVIIGLGVWLVILPFTGFPSSWKTVLTVATGLVALYFGALLFKRARTERHPKNSETKTMSFTETI